MRRRRSGRGKAWRVRFTKEKKYHPKRRFTTDAAAERYARRKGGHDIVVTRTKTFRRK